MLRTPFIIGAVASGAALTGSMTALAAPVTAADLQGKKICWSDGGTPTYGENGAYDERGFGHGTWSLAEVGLRWSRPTASTLLRSPRTMGAFIFSAVSTVMI